MTTLTHDRRFVPAAGSATPLLTIPLPLVPLVVSPKAIVALAAIGALTIIHIRGLGPGSLLQNVLAGLKATALLLIIALGFLLGSGSTAGITAGGTAPVSGMLLALVPVMFSYSGWNAAAYVAEEIRDPGRNVPLALGLGTAVVIAIYVALNALYLYAMPVAELARLPGGRLLDVVAERLFGFATGDLVAVFTIVSLSASVIALSQVNAPARPAATDTSPAARGTVLPVESNPITNTSVSSDRVITGPSHSPRVA